ncbi:MAG: type IX secretion system plug protein domain-containing protein [Rhodothermaceae bacterium]
MKKIFFFILFSMLLIAEEIEIKSLQTYTRGDVYSIPVIYKNDKGSKFLIEFDVAAETSPDLSIKFVYCDRNWNPYDAVLLSTSGKDTDSMLDFVSLPAGNEGADWHCKRIFPNKNVSFPYSGKWMFKIVDTFDEDKVYATGKFYVVEQLVNLSSVFTIDQLDGKPYSQNSLNRSLRLTTKILFGETEIDRFRIKQMEIVENRRLNDPIKITVDEDTDTRYHEWSLGTDFRFVARDIRPGNENRKVSLWNTTKYGQYEVDAHFDGAEIPHFYRELPRDNNGGFLLKKFSDSYANYMDVKFQIKSEFLGDRDLFLTGAFCNWKVLPKYKMEYLNGAYETYVILKRGTYDYKYVTGILDDDKVRSIDWYAVDGNHLSTENVYNVFLFYNAIESGGYDRIIGYTKIYSGYYEQN